jgi:hypothetical protein
LGHWYPTQGRTEVLAGQLKAFEQVAGRPAGDLAATVSSVADTLSRAVRTQGFPEYQVPQWLWLGSQYRLHAGAGGLVAAVAEAALAFLDKTVGRPLLDSDIQDLNWVLETTTRRLGELLDGADVGRHLSDVEISEINSRLATYADAAFDAAYVRERVAELVKDLSGFASAPLLKSVTQKIEALFAVAEDTSFAAKTARAALLYFADHFDTVSDSLGILGLLDDVYVVDLAYVVVEQHTRQLPLLVKLLKSYPYVASLALIGTPLRPLDLFAQYVGCLCLDSLFGEKELTLIVLREVGAFPLLAALFASIEAARRQAAIERERLVEWSVGQHLVMSDGPSTFKVVYLGQVSVGADKRLQVGVDQNGRMSIPLSLTPYLSAARSPHKRLSGGRDIGIWLKNRHADPFLNLTGASRERAGDQECVLLLGARARLDRFVHGIRPLAGDMGAAVGLVYVDAEGHQESIAGTATDAPFIFACSDPDIAHDLIRSPPPGVSGWSVIVDGARQMRALHASLTSDGNEHNPPICGFADLFDRETAGELETRSVAVLYLQDVDVQPPPSNDPEEGQDETERMLGRQGAHWNTVRRTHITPHRFLESVDAWIRRASELKGADPALQHLELLVSTFVRRAVSRPLIATEDNERLVDLGRAIAAQAHGLRTFSSMAAELHQIFADFTKGSYPAFERRAGIAAIAEEEGRGSTAIVCSSAAVAAECREEAQGDPRLDGVVWTNLEGVRFGPRYDRLLVPGWIDRQSMRELAGSGYSSLTEFLFYPFEKRWFDSTTSATARWERKIEVSTAATLRAVGKRLGAVNQDEDHTTGGTDTVQDVEEASDVPEFEKLEARSIESLYRSALHGRESQPIAKAQLVTFDEPGVHAFFPAGGKVIVLSGPAEPSPPPNRQGQAEKLLYRSVSSLEPGWLLAIPLGGDRDLVDAKADQFLATPADTRRTAGIWRVAIRRFIDRTGLDVAAFAHELQRLGISRHPMTIRSWISGSSTVAPRGYREVLPTLVAVTKDSEMDSALQEILQSIDLIYRARQRAADHIVADLFSGEIDLHASEIRVEHEGAAIRYALHRVKDVGDICDMPHEILGRLRGLSPSEVPAEPSL